MLVFSAITPHTPLLVPTVGKEHEKKLTKTFAAYQTLRNAYQAAGPETILIFTPHGPTAEDAVVLNVHDTYTTSLKEFGDLSKKPTYRADLELADRLQRTLRRTEKPITLLSKAALDYGVTVPFTLLAVDPTKTRVLPITQAVLDFKTHFSIGETIKDVIMESPRRIAVIASADLSHRLASDAPLGFNPAGKKFDAAVCEAIETDNVSRLLRITPELVGDAGQCGFRSILMLLGILTGTAYQPKVLAYEAPFGVGYLTVQFRATRMRRR